MSRNRMDFTSRSSTSITKITSGSYQYKINYSQIKTIGIGNFFRSPKFNIGGLEWYIKCYPEGYYENDDGKYFSLYLSLANELNEVSVIFEFCLLDQKGRPATSLRSKNTHTFKRSGKYKGWSKFIKRDELEKYLQDECFEVICSVTILNPKNSCTIVVPPSDLPKQLGQLLLSKESSDIIFEVKGEIFHAHKLVLGLRSPVFKAILFGPMKENRAKIVKINDIEPIIFKNLLHFIYTDSLPNEEEYNGSNYEVIMQHLLVAADRYALERLNLICQERLSTTINIETVATTLALAEQHNCHELKTVCLEFFSLQENYTQIITTDGYKHLILSCPSILKEIEKKFGIGSPTICDELIEHTDNNSNENRFRLLKLFLCSSSIKRRT
ncbi:hypothetical protein LUZ60_002967 [Juncus effusus]|nr:hypothetical protein LUZ60_002967 [Juncus effusus]